ncbi:unnamed protein product [Brachionus calyciflorus]|uniref:Gamma-aminobutyric acid receptor subunit beta n=1 Tax=Brachionus calyciflorus TaxID=104777 RepID=A0A813VNM4_9BILA|nr:unnamed protein product [Brachionus calyciflorus]
MVNLICCQVDFSDDDEEENVFKAKPIDYMNNVNIVNDPYMQKNKPSNAIHVNTLNSPSLPNQNLPNTNQLVGSEKTMEQFLDRLLHESVYDRRIRPFYTDSKSSKPVDVEMNMHINTISGISEVNMEYTVDCYFRQEWFDPRLTYSNSSWKHVEDITLHYDLVNKVWTPDAFFRNSKDAKSHKITVPNRLIRIFPEGRVLFSQRLTLRLECPMKLQKFPLDNQTCTINIGSFGYTLKDIKFEWKKNVDGSPSVTISNKLEMPDFILTTHNSSVCQRKTSTGSYACLEVHFYLKRSFGYYLVQVYIPSILTCLIAFVSFWVDHKAVPARISVGLLTVLTVTTQSSGIRSQLPKVSYIKAIDVWMSACLVFVFAALLEYAVVNVIARKQELKRLVRQSERNKRKAQMTPKLPSYSPTNEKVLVIGNRLAHMNSYNKSDIDNHNSHEALESLLQPNRSGSIKKNPQSNHSLHVDSVVSISGVSQQSVPPASTPQAPPLPPRDDAQMVDFVSSFLFPISFIIFNIIYWMVYLNMQVDNN